MVMTILNSLVQLKLDYCSQLWSPADQSSINKLEAVQKHLGLHQGPQAGCFGQLAEVEGTSALLKRV